MKYKSSFFIHLKVVGFTKDIMSTKEKRCNLDEKPPLIM